MPRRAGSCGASASQEPARHGKMGAMTNTMTPARRAPADVSPATAAALSTMCPACNAAAETWCLTLSGGRASRMHEARYRAAPALDADGVNGTSLAVLDQLTGQVARLTAELEQAHASLSAASRNESDCAAELAKIQPRLRAATAARDDLAEQLATARRACEVALEQHEAAAGQISDLQAQVRELSKRKATPAPAAAATDTGWVADGARRYLESKFRRRVGEMTAGSIINMTERWLWLAASGDQAAAMDLMTRIEDRWAQIHANCR